MLARGLLRWIAALLLGFSTLGSASAQSSPIDSVPDALNATGRLLMLPERIVKAYCQTGLEVPFVDSQGQLDGAVKAFQSNLEALQAFAPSAELSALLGEVDKRWTAFKAVATRKVNHAGARNMAFTGEVLLERLRQVQTQLQTLSNQPATRLVALASRGRTLSQRIAKYYMLHAWEFTDTDVLKALGEARQAFADTLAELQGASANTPEIKAILSDVAAQWQVFELSFQRDEAVPLMIAKSSEKIFNEMDGVVQLYARVGP